VVEIGRHDELLARRNLYARLYELQLLEIRRPPQAELEFEPASDKVTNAT
jgi:hypothetical protein